MNRITIRPERRQIRKSNLFLQATMICLLILPLAAVSPAQTASPGKSKNILYLSVYQMDLPTNVIAVRTIQESFKQAGDMKVDIYYEYLDLNRFPDAGYQKALFDFYARKYRDKPIDLVMVGSRGMLDLWIKHRPGILSAVPVIFYDIATRRYAEMQLPTGVTGVVSDIDYARSVRWVLEVRPSINEVVLVHGVGPTDRTFAPDRDDLQATLRGQVTFTDWSSFSFEEIKRRAAVLPNTTVVLYSLMFEDAARVRYRPREALKELAAASAVPVLSGYDQFIGTGTIGGYMYSIEQQAREASRMGLRILRGEPVSAIPVLQNRGTQFMFDHRALQRWDIPLFLLPPESIVKNRQYTIWERYYTDIVGFMAILAILLMLVAFLFRLTYQLRKARRDLVQLNADLEMQVQARTGELKRANEKILEREAFSRNIFEKHSAILLLIEKSTGMIMNANQAALNYYGYTLAEMRSRSIYSINQMSSQETEAAMEMVRSGHRESFEFRHRLANGDIRDVEVHSVSIIYKDADYLFSIIHDITDRNRMKRERELMIADLRKALADIKTLSGMLPICSSCKKIRDDKGYWNQIETYIRQHSEAEFSHSLCPDCAKQLYPGIFKDHG